MHFLYLLHLYKLTVVTCCAPCRALSPHLHGKACPSPQSAPRMQILIEEILLRGLTCKTGCRPELEGGWGPVDGSQQDMFFPAQYSVVSLKQKSYRPITRFHAFNFCIFTCIHTSYYHILSVFASIDPYIHPPIHPYIHTYAYMHTCIHPCIHACIHPSIYPPIHPSIHASLHT